MKPYVKLDVKEVKEFLLEIALIKSVFIWGPPGIGKSSIVEQFAKELDLECVALLGSQLAAEDLIGIPQIKGDVSKFIPPSLIVRNKPFCLFIDELNIGSPEIQKAFYSLILNQRIGEYVLPKGSIVIGAGNRSADSALVNQLPSALINRMIHVHLTVNHKLWIEWAQQNEVHTDVIEYIKTRPSQLFTEIPPSEEKPFSSPRSWKDVSDGLKKLDNHPNTKLVDALLYGSLSEEHVSHFKSFRKQLKHKFSVSKILNGEIPWPREAENRDVLLFLVESAKDYLFKELPKNENQVTSQKKQLVANVKNSLKDLARIDNEYAETLLSPNSNGENLPKWVLLEIAKELPKLISLKQKEKEDGTK